MLYEVITDRPGRQLELLESLAEGTLGVARRGVLAEALLYGLMQLQRKIRRTGTIRNNFV